MSDKLDFLLREDARAVLDDAGFGARVMRALPPPAGTSGAFVLADPTNSILMANPTLGAFPPTLGSSYTITAGTKTEASIRRMVAFYPGSFSGVLGVR